MNLPVRILLIALAAGTSFGCGPSEGRLKISGTVNLDGTPLDDGIVSFYDTEGQKPSVEAVIQAGSFQVPAEKGPLPGTYIVAIDAADASGATARPDQYTMEIPVSRIPPQYNLETTLTANVDPGASNNFVFDLKSGK